MDSHEWDQRYEGAELVWTAEPNRFLVREVQGLPPGRALDLAAGEGRNAVWLAQQGWQVTAVDFSRVGLEKAQRLAAHRGVEIETQQADLEAYQPRPRGFDLVVVLYLHVPWERMAPILGRAADAVAPGGTFLLVGHDRENVERGYGGPPRPEVLYGPDEVAASLRGLEVVRAERVDRYVDTDEGVRTAIDVLVRAVRPAT